MPIDLQSALILSRFLPKIYDRLDNFEALLIRYLSLHNETVTTNLSVFRVSSAKLEWFEENGAHSLAVCPEGEFLLAELLDLQMLPMESLAFALKYVHKGEYFSPLLHQLMPVCQHLGTHPRDVHEFLTSDYALYSSDSLARLMGESQTIFVYTPAGMLIHAILQKLVELFPEDITDAQMLELGTVLRTVGHAYSDLACPLCEKLWEGVQRHKGEVEESVQRTVSRCIDEFLKKPLPMGMAGVVAKLVIKMFTVDVATLKYAYYVYGAYRIDREVVEKVGAKIPPPSDTPFPAFLGLAGKEEYHKNVAGWMKGVDPSLWVLKEGDLPLLESLPNLPEKEVAIARYKRISERRQQQQQETEQPTVKVIEVGPKRAETFVFEGRPERIDAEAVRTLARMQFSSSVREEELAEMEEVAIAHREDVRYARAFFRVAKGHFDLARWPAAEIAPEVGALVIENAVEEPSDEYVDTVLDRATLYSHSAASLAYSFFIERGVRRSVVRAVWRRKHMGKGFPLIDAVFAGSKAAAEKMYSEFFAGIKVNVAPNLLVDCFSSMVETLLDPPCEANEVRPPIPIEDEEMCANLVDAFAHQAFFPAQFLVLFSYFDMHRELFTRLRYFLPTPLVFNVLPTLVDRPIEYYQTRQPSFTRAFFRSLLSINAAPMADAKRIEVQKGLAPVPACLMYGGFGFTHTTGLITEEISLELNIPCVESAGKVVPSEEQVRIFRKWPDDRLVKAALAEEASLGFTGDCIRECIGRLGAKATMEYVLANKAGGKAAAVCLAEQMLWKALGQDAAVDEEFAKVTPEALLTM